MNTKLKFAMHIAMTIVGAYMLCPTPWSDSTFALIVECLPTVAIIAVAILEYRADPEPKVKTILAGIVLGFFWWIWLPFFLSARMFGLSYWRNPVE
jgi:hypothetical protein